MYSVYVSMQNLIKSTSSCFDIVCTGTDDTKDRGKGVASRWLWRS